jgi:hypothetical protein
MNTDLRPRKTRISKYARSPWRMRVDILAIMKFRPFLAILALVLPIWAQTVDLSGSWVLVKTEDKISAPNSGAAPPVPGGGTAPGHNPGGQSRTGGYPAGGGSQPVPELAMPDLEGLELIILQSADEIRIERRWQVLDKTRSIRQVYPLDGKEIVNEAYSAEFARKPSRGPPSPGRVFGLQGWEDSHCKNPPVHSVWPVRNHAGFSQRAGRGKVKAKAGVGDIRYNAGRPGDRNRIQEISWKGRAPQRE